MNKLRRQIFHAVGIAFLAFAVSAFSAISPGLNNSGALSSESEVGSPIGQTDFQTDPFTGRFSYAVPFELAPARHNSTPKIELAYNSANPNGWCGLGWDIDLGYIERETKYGVPVVWQGNTYVKKY